MYLKAIGLYLYTYSPVHAGAGSSLSAVDLPIQRERITGFPIIQSGSLKGALKDAARSKYGDSQKDLLAAIFGPDDTSFTSAIGVGDAQILLFPVRSLKGVFAWATCSMALNRWARTMKDIHTNLPEIPPAPTRIDDTPPCYALEGVVMADGYVVLEDMVLKNQAEPNLTDDRGMVSALADWLATAVFPNEADWQTRLKKNLIILPDDEFSFFVQHATEVKTRVRLNPDTKNVETGALWTEEHLPEDTLLYAPVYARRIMSLSQKECVKNLRHPDDPPKEAEEVLTNLQQNLNGIIQLGGDETTGHGFVRLIWMG